VLCYLAVAVGLVWLGFTRWHTAPGDPSAVYAAGTFGSLPIDPDRDRTEELTAALAALPPEPPLVLPPPPEGMCWKASERWATAAGRPIDLGEALRGEWTPDTRLALRGVIDYLESAEVASALAQIASVEPGGWRPFGSQGLPSRGLQPVYRAAQALVARARYRHAGQGDLDEATADLQAAYSFASLTGNCDQLVGIRMALWCESLADTELQHLAREHSLSAATAGEVVSALETVKLSREQLWTYVANAVVGEMQLSLDAAFTNDGRGDGWLALSWLDDITQTAHAADRRCGAWNMLSPLFNDRRTVAAKIARLGDAYQEAARQPYAEARSTLRANNRRTVFSIADGLLATGPYLMVAHTYDILIRQCARRQATVIAVALSAYRTDHGHYPESLDELLDGHLDALPLDPHDDRPLRYRLQDDAGYLLYSVGPNLTDEGGRVHTTDPVVGWSNLDGDWLFNLPRPEPLDEPELEEVKP
jgi:hypothetical protein